MNQFDYQTGRSRDFAKMAEFATLTDAIYAGWMQEQMHGSRFQPIDARTISDEKQRAAFNCGYEASLSGDPCPTTDDLASFAPPLFRPNRETN